MSANTGIEYARPPRPVAVSVAVSTIAQLLARGVHLCVNVGISLALIRYFGPRRYGDFVFVITVTAVFALVSEFGLRNLAVRSISRDPAVAPLMLGSVLAARMATGLVTAAAAQFVCLAFGADRTVHYAVLVSSMLFFTDALMSIGIIFQVELRQEYDAAIRATIELLELVMIVVLIRRSAGLVAIVAAPVTSAWIGVALMAFMARLRFGLRLRVDWRALPALLREAFPFALIGIAGVAYLKLDALVLVALRPRTDVGVYGAAFQPIENVLLTSIILTNVLFPILAATYVPDRERFRKVYQSGAEALVAVVAPVPMILLVLGDPFVQSVYASKYAGAVRPLQTLAFALIFMVVNVWQGFVLVAAGRQQATLVYVSVAIVLNVIVDVFLVHRYGPQGAAVGTLLTSLFLVACSTIAVSRLTGSRLDLVRFARIAVPMVALAATVWVLYRGFGLPWWISLLGGSAAWPVMLRVAGLFSIAEARTILKRPSQSRLSEVTP